MSRIKLTALLLAMACGAMAQSVGVSPGTSGGGGSGNATALQGTPVASTVPTDGTCLVYVLADLKWEPSSCSGTASTAFSALTGSTNTTAAMVVGTGASLAATGTGTIVATSVPAAGLGAGTISNATSGNAATATAPQSGHSTGTGNFVLATSPTLVTPALGTPSGIVLTNASGLPFSALPALPWACSNPGLGDGLNAIPAGTYLQSNCFNATGHTVTITGILCYTDNGGTSTMDVTNGAGTDLLTGAITCSASFAAGTQGTTTTIASGDFAKFTFVADGSSKQTSWVIEGTY